MKDNLYLFIEKGHLPINAMKDKLSFNFFLPMSVSIFVGNFIEIML